jgi:hypothetical protein
MASKRMKKPEADTLRMRSRKRRGRLLISGALIVVLTFIVKEIVMYALKASSDNIQVRVAALGSDNPVINVNTRLLPVHEELAKLGPKLKAAQQNAPVSKNDIELEDSNRTQIFVHAEQELILISDLQDALFRQSPELPEMRRKAQEQFEGLRQEAIELGREKRPFSSEPRTVYSRILVSEIDILEAQVSWTRWNGMVVSCAEQLRKSLDYNYHVCQLASYALYLIGIIVGVGGQWYGTEMKLSGE